MRGAIPPLLTSLWRSAYISSGIITLTFTLCDFMPDCVFVIGAQDMGWRAVLNTATELGVP